MTSLAVPGAGWARPLAVDLKDVALDNNNVISTEHIWCRRGLLASEVHEVCRCRFILSGYRANDITNWEIVQSLFQLHNESVNTWSHIIGSILLIWWLQDVSFNGIAGAGDTDAWLCAYFLSSLLVVHLTSVFFHLYLCKNAKTYILTLALDNCGTMLGGLSIQFVGTWYGLREAPAYRTACLAIYCTFFAIAAGRFLRWPNTSLFPSKTKIMVIFFNQWHIAFLGFYFFAGWPKCTRDIYIWGWSGFWCFVLGLSIFSARIPERWKPGMFDIFCHR